MSADSWPYGHAQGCQPCQDAIDLDQIALVKFEGDAEIAVIACDEHLRRLVLAIELLEAFEKVEQITIPPLVEVSFADRVPSQPDRRTT